MMRTRKLRGAAARAVKKEELLVVRVARARYWRDLYRASPSPLDFVASQPRSSGKRLFG
jgi:hypothetical protein